MKKLFFYANFRTYDYTLGITRKVYAQIEAFRGLGYDVFYSGYLKDGVAIFDGQGKIVCFRKFFTKNRTLQHLLRRGMLMDICTQYFRQSEEKFDLVYLRYHFFDKKYCKLLDFAKKHSRAVVIEAHSAPKFSKNLSPMTYVALKDRIWSKNAYKYVSFVASMSDEKKLWNVDTIKISNAIELDSVRLHEYENAENEIHFISVSFERDVHGYDRLIRGIRNYYDNGGNRTIMFHMVGTTLASTEKLIQQCGLEKRCITYGPLCGEALDDVYDRANIAVGCLGNHRIGSYFGSALKTKEYIAKGIPFIYGWNEKILEKFPYAQKFDLKEDPIDIFKVIAFYDGLDKADLAMKIRGCLGVEDTWDYQMNLVVSEVERRCLQ